MSSRQLGIYYCGAKDGRTDCFVIYNMHWLAHTFALPALPKGKSWYRAASTDEGVLREPAPMKEQDVYKRQGVKTGFVMWPVRTAVSGKQNTPGGATEIMEILGKEESIARIKKGIAVSYTHLDVYKRQVVT